METLKQQTITRINTIKADETLTSSEKQKRLQESQVGSEKLNSIITNNNNSSLPIISTVGLISLLGLIVYKIRKTRIRK